MNVDKSNAVRIGGNPTKKMSASADLHVHSKYSDRPSEWLLRRIGAPESFTDPRAVYNRCRAKGMDFVTITDHNAIEGALEIAHLPGAFVSGEVTTYFPEDGCKIHCLVLGIDEEQFRLINEARQNIYELRDYLLDAGIVHSIAHPLFSVNEKLTVEHFERLLVLFKRFELINGARNARAQKILVAILHNLTPQMIDAMADRYDLDPRDHQPWEKYVTGGSDDHSGLNIGTAFTETPPASTVESFLGHLAHGRHAPGGSAGSSLKLARDFYTIGYRYYRHRLLGEGAAPSDVISEVFERLVTAEQAAALGRAEKLRLMMSRFVRPRDRTMGEIDRQVATELINLAAVTESTDKTSVEDRSFMIASGLSHKLCYASLRRFAKYLAAGKLTESLETVSSLGPAALCGAPYLAAFRAQHKDEPLLRAVAGHFPFTLELRRRGERKAWFTDTFLEHNGVASTVESCVRAARKHHRDLKVVTSLEKAPADGDHLQNFLPIGRFQLPEQGIDELSLPPVLHMIEYCERENFGEIIVSTPGPVGLTGVAAARLLGLQLTGVYHADFPQYVRHLTQSPTLEILSDRFVQWFFETMDVILVPSEFHLTQLRDKGLHPGKLRLLPRAVDRELFSPTKRDPLFFRRFGMRKGFKYLYVGRISKDKNLDSLLQAFVGLLAEGPRADLVLVGEGPYLDELRSRYRSPEILFTGYLDNDDLARAYAGADVFVYPGSADAFANTVLEAQASGLPAIVNRQSASREIVEDSGGGLAVDVEEVGQLVEAMSRLFHNEEERLSMARLAVESCKSRVWEALVEGLWATGGARESTLSNRRRIKPREVHPFQSRMAVS